MKIAIPTIGGILDEYFEHCEVFTIFTLDESYNITDSEILYTPEDCGCKSNIPLIMQSKGVSVVLANRIPQHADGVCTHYGITPHLGYSGTVKEVIESFIIQKKQLKPTITESE